MTNQKTFTLWIQYEDNSVSFSNHDSVELASAELFAEKQDIIEDLGIGIYAYEITPNF